MNKNDILNYLKSHKEHYCKKYGIEFIGVFGSFARNEANQNSDIDILYKIKKDKKLSMFKYLQITKELENFFQKKIDLVRYEVLKPKIKKYIQQDIEYV